MKNQRIKLIIANLKVGLTLFLGMPATAFAEANISSVLMNLQNQLPELTSLLTGFCYVAGFGLVLVALFHLRKYGEMRTMMAANADLKGPIIQIIVGSCLLQLPLVLQISLETTFGTDNPLAYPGGNDSGWNELANTIILILQFVGGVAMTRGLLLFNKLGSGQAQPGTFGKAMIHIIGGTLCFNSYGTAQVLFSTLGLFSS